MKNIIYLSGLSDKVFVENLHSFIRLFYVRYPDIQYPAGYQIRARPSGPSSLLILVWKQAEYVGGPRRIEYKE